MEKPTKAWWRTVFVTKTYSPNQLPAVGLRRTTQIKYVKQYLHKIPTVDIKVTNTCFGKI